ncbi:MAG: peptide/nickel transport system substrate-binding protein [Acidimicrobiaceae bacterium]|jgi:peptide/nickel transport system substrate-binding protein
MPRRPLSSLAALLAAGLLVGACSSSTTSSGTSSTSSKDTLKLAYLSDMSTPDPDVFYDIEGNTVILSAYEGLVKYKPDSTEIIPSLAKSWDISPDKLTYTFHLQDGVKFHDGTPFDSAAVKTEFERRLAVAAAPAYMLMPVATMATPDPSTFVVTLKSVVGPFMDYMASSWGPKMISPKALADNAGSDNAQTWLKEHADGTGPLMLTAFNRGQQYEMARFDGYWGAKAKFAKVDIRIVPDMGTQRLQLQSGDLDVILHSFPVAELPSVQGNANLAVKDFSSFLQSLLYVNTNKAPFSDPAMRKAVAGAIDRDALVKEVYGAYGAPAGSPYAPGILDQSLAPASYPSSSAKVPGAGPISLVYTADESGVQRRLAELIQQKLTAAGFTPELKEVQLPQVYEYVNDVKAAPDLLLMTNTPDAAHPDTWSRILWGSKGGLNFLGYSNPAVDQLLDQGAQAADKAASDAAYGQAGRLLVDDGAILFIANAKDVMVMAKDLTGVEHVPNYPWALNLGALGRG